jgi:hypothetical protein
MLILQKSGATIKFYDLFPACIYKKCRTVRARVILLKEIQGRPNATTPLVLRAGNSMSQLVRIAFHFCGGDTSGQIQ